MWNITIVQTPIRENTKQQGTFRVSEDYEGRGDARGLRENRLQRVDDTPHHKKEIKLRLLVLYLNYKYYFLLIIY